MICGDINIRLERKDDKEVRKFNELLQKFNLKQHISEATHIKNCTLDVIVTKNNNLVKNWEAQGRITNSDHFPVTATLENKKEKENETNEIISFRHTKNIYLDKLKDRMKCSKIT